MSFGSRLRERREAMGIKQKDLGALLGVSGNAIWNYETGVSSPNANVLYKVFEVLQCDANYLYQDEMREYGIAVPEQVSRCVEDDLNARFDEFWDTLKDNPAGIAAVREILAALERRFCARL